MILVFGGAYQGKRDFAKQQFDVKTIHECEAPKQSSAAAEDPGRRGGAVPAGEPSAADGPGIPAQGFAADAICGMEKFVRTCCGEDPERRIEAADWMREHRQLWQDKVLIITDVSQGIVPIEARTRAFREMNGRLMLYLASEADEVWRVFCGIGKRIR